MKRLQEPELSAFFLLFVENFLCNCAFNASSLLPPYLVSLGAEQTFVGFYNTLGTLLIVVVVVFFGRPLVRLPRVRVLRWGFFLLVATSALSWVFSGSLVLLAVFKLVGSLAQVFSSTLMVSLLFDLGPPEKRAGSLAMFSVAGMFTNPVASLAGEAVLRSMSGPGLFLLGGGFAVLSWLWSLFLREPPSRPPVEEPHSFKEVLSRRDLRPLFALAFSFGIYYSALTSFLPRHTQITLGEANLSAFLIPFSLVSVGIRLVLGKQLDQRPPRRFLYLSFLAIFAAQILLLLPPAWPWLILSGFFYGVGHSILYPLMNALFVGAGGEDQKASYSNAYLVANQLGAVLMTPLLGALGDLGGFFSIIVVLALVALGSFFLVRAKFPRLTADPPSGRSS
jgi:predicted MFS family arabinose efflux permease